MSARLAKAIVEHIRKIKARSKFVRIESISELLAAEISASWDDSDGDLPRLAVASATPALFGPHALEGVSAARLRHTNPGGVCIVICEGSQIPERQSINSFTAVSPADLLRDKSRLLLISNAVSPVRRDGPPAAVREAIVTMLPGLRPPALAVANYFDAIASNADPLESLPLLGGFRDSAVAPADIRGDRIKENLLLANDRRSEEVVSATDYANIRARAVRVLGRAGGPERSERFMHLLESGGDEILELITFDEAREILATVKKGLSQEVRAQIQDHRRDLLITDPERVTSIPWDAYTAYCQKLDRSAERQQAAREILAFNGTENSSVLTAETRKRLESLLRDRTVNASPGSNVEVGIAKGILNLGIAPTELGLVGPHVDGVPDSQSKCRDWCVLALARLRLGCVLSDLQQQGCHIDADLTGEVLGGLDLQQARLALLEARPEHSSLPALKLRLRNGRGSVEVSWGPDIDDVALLRTIIEYADNATLTLRMIGAPEPFYFSTYPEFATEPLQGEATHLAQRLSLLAADALRDGLVPRRLQDWAAGWAEMAESTEALGGGETAEILMLAGCVEGAREDNIRTIGMTALAPVKAEWLAALLEAGQMVITQAMGLVAEETRDSLRSMAFDTACQGLVGVTAAHCPSFLRVCDDDAPLLPSKETRIWAVFGGRPGIMNFERQALEAIDSVLKRLLRLQPEAAGHLKCLAVGPSSAALMLTEAVDLVGRSVGGVEVATVEVFAVAARPGEDAALDEALRLADRHVEKQEAGQVRLRYLTALDAVRTALGPALRPVHFTLLTGLTGEGRAPVVSFVEIPVPPPGSEVLFCPRVWQRPGSEYRVLLVPPSTTETSAAWLKTAQAVDDRWPEQGSPISVPEIRVGSVGASDDLRTAHDLSVWVATLDRYASRESLERAMRGEVAILHQERRLGSESALGLVVSQQSGGPVDRAIGRSLRQARIVDDEDESVCLGADLRKVVAQGYGILALEAATSGTGINELVGHVVGFSMLGTTSTPWPLPADCQLVLVSLDEHPHWFNGQKRADLLAIAIDPKEKGLHVAVIEVKARRSDEVRAATEALEQLRRTLLATESAAQPDCSSLATRIWLNRIAESVYAVARESRIRLSAMEIEAVEAFRRGAGTLEWAGLGLVFGPNLADSRRVQHQTIGGDRIPIAMHEVRLTQQRLEDAVGTDLRNLRTSATDIAPLGGGRKRRRPETGVERGPRDEGAQQSLEDGAELPQTEFQVDKASESNHPEMHTPVSEDSRSEGSTPPTFQPPLLGWDLFTGEGAIWRAAGPAALSNGHVQIWGSSGAGKTQFVKMLLAQLAFLNDTHFGIADFKNDYGEEFPESVGAEFIDLWGQPGARYNPLALDRANDQVTRIIEFRDMIEQAMASYQRVGARQKAGIEEALRAAYREAAKEGSWPTMLDLNRFLTPDIQHLLNDLTRNEIFTAGPPLSEVINRNTVFGLNRIPGNGQTTVLAAAFILASIALTIQDLPPVANTIRYAVVIDEAHRVSRFRALDLMIREGRSKGLAVILATQSPGDLPEVVDINAQTRICFRLSDAMVAGQAARKLDPNDDGLAARIRTLESGEAFVSLQGGPPRLLRMCQHYRDVKELAGDNPPWQIPESVTGRLHFSNNGS